METAVKLDNILKQSNTSGKCERCGHGFKHRDNRGTLTWCRRCLDVSERKSRLTSESAERRIFKLVGSLYAEANLKDLDEQIQSKLKDLECGQDLFLYGPVGTGNYKCRG